MNRLAAALLLVGLLGAAPASAKNPSEACARGFVAPSTTPTGIGVRTSTDHRTAAVTVCNDGSALPAPGAAKASADTARTSVIVLADGDPGNSVLACSSGYIAAKASSGGVKLYEAKTGDYSTHAHAKSPDRFAGDVVADCAPSAPTTTKPAKRPASLKPLMLKR